MNDHPNDSFDDLMRRALSEEADRIEPADALPEIQARVRTQRRPAPRRPWVITAGAAAVGTAAAIGAFTVLPDNAKTAGDDEVAGPPAITTSATIPPSSIPATPTTGTLPPTTASEEPKVARGTPEPIQSAAVPVYWLGAKVGTKTEPAVRLYRTWAKVIQGRPALEAVRVMTSRQPGDPDYYSAWRGAEVNSVTRSNGVVTVDFKQLPQTRLDAAAADVAAQQLVYTVQGALNNPRDRVQITQQGRAGTMLFGQVDTSRPLSRAEATKVQALVWIDNLTEGQITRSPLTVTGTAAAFEAQVNWRATNLKTRAIQTDYVNTKEGQKFSPFAIPLKLTPGQWRIEAYLISAEDGRITDTDSKTVTVNK
jgi:immunoglobulin-like protein involved in spore germination/sporulation and spore germination protein